MGKNLLSIDWDYFIPIKRKWCGSYIENRRNNINIWYKRYFEDIKNGENIEKSVRTGRELIGFWNRIKRYFIIKKEMKMYVSDSHKISYYIAKDNKCDKVINFDAHSDLGYGGLKSLNFELNCGNWLGKLLKNKIVQKVSIIYSPYTYESKKEFKEINEKFHVSYHETEDFKDKIAVDYIHICRSGSWTPPWLDAEFYGFIKSLNRPYKIFKCPKREWDPKGLTLSDKIYITL